MREVSRPTPRDIREQFKPVGSRIARVALVPGLIFMVNAAACTPARGVEPQIQPPPAAAAEMASPTAKSDLATAVPTEAKPTVAPTESPRPVIETVSQEQALKMVKDITNSIKNPDPEVLKKYNISQDRLTEEQAIMLYGGVSKGGIPVPGFPTTPEGTPYDPERSLTGIEALINTGDFVGAKTLIKKVYQTVSNASFNDSAQIAGRKTAQQIDPENLFHGLVMIRPGETIPDDQPLPPGAPSNLGGVHGSEVKKDAVIGLINLYYRLPAGK